MDSLQAKVYEGHRNLVDDNLPVTIEILREKLRGTKKKDCMILEVFHHHNDQVEQLLGKEFATGTLERYKTSLEHTRNFLQWKYQIADLEITRLDYEFISEYAFWLKSIRNCRHNTTMKYLANFKKIVLICVKNGWLQKEPFTGFKLAKKKIERPFLTEQELQTIASKVFPTERLNYVRDIFLFSCYTGLAYANVEKLKRSEITVGVDGEKWIFTKRDKTDSSTKIPLWPSCLAILNRYADNP